MDEDRERFYSRLEPAERERVNRRLNEQVHRESQDIMDAMAQDALAASQAADRAANRLQLVRTIYGEPPEKWRWLH